MLLSRWYGCNVWKWFDRFHKEILEELVESKVEIRVKMPENVMHCEEVLLFFLRNSLKLRFDLIFLQLAFSPKQREEKKSLVHPLVCPLYNQTLWCHKKSPSPFYFTLTRLLVLWPKKKSTGYLQPVILLHEWPTFPAILIFLMVCPPKQRTKVKILKRLPQRAFKECAKVPS